MVMTYCLMIGVVPLTSFAEVQSGMVGEYLKISES